MNKQPRGEYEKLQKLIEETRDVAGSLREDAPATAGFLDGVREDLREGQRMYRKESLKGRIQAEMFAVKSPVESEESEP